MLACVILPLPQNSPAGWVTPPYGTIKNIALVEGAYPARNLTKPAVPLPAQRVCFTII